VNKIALTPACFASQRKRGAKIPPPFERGAKIPPPFERGAKIPSPFERGAKIPSPFERGSENPLSLWERARVRAF
jgi:hypothetical protein